MSLKAQRVPWTEKFPAVLIHAQETLVKHHASYANAKGGDVDAALRLVADLLDVGKLSRLWQLGIEDAVLVPVHGKEMSGVNVSPSTMAEVIGDLLHWEVDLEVVQANIVGHTGSTGFMRLANRPFLWGRCVPTL
jgi:hypothetical protein